MLSAEVKDHGCAAEPTGDASWWAVVALGVGAFAFVTTELLPVGLVPQISLELGISDGQAGMMITAPGLAAAIGAPLSIAIAGGIDRRTMLCLFLSMMCLSNVIVVLSTGFMPVLVARILMGLGLGGFWTIAGSLGARLRRGPEGVRATAIILSGISLGTVAGVPAGTLIGSLAGWRAPFLASAILGAVMVATLLALMPRVAPQRGSGVKAFPQILRRPSSILALLVSIILFVGQFAAYTYISPYLGQSVRIDATMLSVAFLLYGIAGFVGNMVAGWLAARHSQLAVLASAIVIAASIVLLSVFGTTIPAAVLFVMLWGFGFGMAPVSAQTLTLDTAPDHLEGAAALLVCSLNTAIGLGSLFGGVIVDHSSVRTALEAGAGAAAIAAAVLLVMMLRTLVSTKIVILVSRKGYQNGSVFKVNMF